MIVSMFAYLLASGQTAAAEGQVPAAPPAPALLWRDLRQEMSPTQVADVLRTIEGVESVEVKQRKNKPSVLNIKYASAGISLGALRVTVQPAFENEKLTVISLISDECRSTMVEQARLTADLLAQKYGPGVRERVVDPSGATVEYRMAYSNNETRVRISLADYAAPGAEHVYSTGRVGSALAALSNSMADATAAEAVARCPVDNGARSSMIITYSSQAQFLVEHAHETADRDAKIRATAEGL